MTLTDEEIRKLAQSISKRPEQMTADGILDLVTSLGRQPLNNKEGRCQAFASLFRTLLADPQIQQMLQLARERSQFQTVLKTLQERMTATAATQVVNDEFFVARSIIEQISNTREAVAREIELLGNNRDVEKKIQLMEQVAKILTTLQCDEKFDFPSVTMRRLE